MSHDSGDCSDRICPFEFAWVDSPDKIGNHHKYAECAAKGICDRGSGECGCFPGYEGKACARTTCPNSCSGHGNCNYIEDLPFQNVPEDYINNNYDRSFLSQDPKLLTYDKWDLHKTRACICDPEWADIDCSKRMCPYGTDVMDIRNNMLVAAKYQTQQIFFEAGSTTASTLNGQTFALTFKSRLNETFSTWPIYYDTSATGFHDFMNDIEVALEGLPNQVIDDVEVHGSYGATPDSATVNITFVGSATQGPQHLLTVRSYLCGDGCTPKITGLELMPKSQNITEVTLSDFNSFECGRRGKCDYTSGMCSCFAGYTGASCNTITALV